MYGPTACPAGATELSQGFNPGKSPKKRLALKGREMGVSDEARTYGRAKVKVRWDVPSKSDSALLGRSIWRPLQGASLLVDDSQG
jgi:hypothetical protein